ncbi:MAG: hypothetical protein FJW30_12195 [Acidobacteria bacterium]|nr:hypothetical protein [Acidobacteriota bacterium]
MNPILRNVLAVLGGAVAGSIVNGGLIMISGHVIPPPGGADVTTLEGLRASIHLFEPKHFLFPFLAHALGTLAGAFLAAKLGASRHAILAGIVGGLFFIGGSANVMMLPAPMWFNIVDLVGAYFPMAWIAAKLSARPGA